MAGDSERDLDHPSDVHGAYIICSKWSLMYIARVHGKITAPGGQIEFSFSDTLSKLDEIEHIRNPLVQYFKALWSSG